VQDSKVIEDAKESILNALVRIDEKVNVEERKQLKKFAKAMKKAEKK